MCWGYEAAPGRRSALRVCSEAVIIMPLNTSLEALFFMLLWGSYLLVLVFSFPLHILNIQH